MNLANTLVLLMAAQCAAASVAYLLDGQDALALMFFGYTIANGGILWTALR
jgi:hypothetical protein